MSTTDVASIQEHRIVYGSDSMSFQQRERESISSSLCLWANWIYLSLNKENFINKSLISIDGSFNGRKSMQKISHREEQRIVGHSQ